jgi:YqaJ-like viral recombinase domain
MSRFTIIDCEQRSDEWVAARAGRVTGSKAGDVLAKIKTGEAAARRDYRFQLAIERLTGKPAEPGYVSAEMQRGIDLEPAARLAYEAHSGLIVRETGFLSMNEIMAGCSLDGDVDDFKGLVSFKCPKSATHVEYMKAHRLPPAYVPQATHEMWVTGAEWYDFCSYDDRLPEGLQFFCVRVERSEFKAELAAYEIEVSKFLAEVDAEVQSLTKMRSAA